MQTAPKMAGTEAGPTFSIYPNVAEAGGLQSQDAEGAAGQSHVTLAHYLYVPFEHRTSNVQHRTSNDGFSTLSQFINRQNAFFDVGCSMLEIQMFLHAIALGAAIVHLIQALGNPDIGGRVLRLLLNWG
jgi:hypothetical protein